MIRLVPKPLQEIKSMEPLVFNARETAKLLDVSLRTLRRLTSQGKIPFVKVGGRVLYPRKRLEAFLNREE